MAQGPVEVELAWAQVAMPWFDWGERHRHTNGRTPH
jgi:hypothetical protein